MNKPCIGIIGAGKVGAETANKKVQNRLADCMLFDTMLAAKQPGASHP